MGDIHPPRPVKLIAGMIFCDEECLKGAEKRLVGRFGEIDFESRPLPFTYTSYYQQEMGKDLFRKFVSFKHLIDPGEIASIKVFTTALEEKFFFPRTSKRRVNIDPGYIDLARLVLATTKDFAHRVYLQKGIYAEVTLTYQKGEGFQPREWTYPDYKTGDYINIFNHIRDIYKQDLNSSKLGEDDETTDM